VFSPINVFTSSINSARRGARNGAEVDRDFSRAGITFPRKPRAQHHGRNGVSYHYCSSGEFAFHSEEDCRIDTDRLGQEPRFIRVPSVTIHQLP
jgi:hypothetical protein